MKLIGMISSVLFVFWYHSPNILDTPRNSSASQEITHILFYPEDALERSREPATCPYREPDQSSTRPPHQFI
jgi:hypothetical protein